jgi:hypothetical protein
VSCKYDFPVQTSHVLSLQNKYKLKMKNDSGYQSSGKYLNRRVGYPVFDKRYSFLRQPSASPTYLSALSRRTTQLLRLGSKIRTNITLYQLVNLILGTINIPSYASLHNMKDSRRQRLSSASLMPSRSHCFRHDHCPSVRARNPIRVIQSSLTSMYTLFRLVTLLTVVTANISQYTPTAECFLLMKQE